MKAFLLTGNMKGAARQRIADAIGATGIRSIVVQVVDEHSRVRQVSGADILIVDVRYLTHKMTNAARALHPNIPFVTIWQTNADRVRETIAGALRKVGGG